jgi:predicted RNA-binding Zn ribbon-like protein
LTIQNSLDLTVISILDGYMSSHPKLHQGNRAGSLTLLGGSLALDFANTESGRNSSHHLNHLEKGADLVSWAVHAKAITADEEVLARSTLQTHHGLADQLLKQGCDLRNIIYRINADTADGKRPTQMIVRNLAEHYRHLLGVAEFDVVDDKYIWRWNVHTQLVAAILGPIAKSALDLLMNQSHARIKQCGGNCCGWLFYDLTKNNSRRWCEMSVCGNRAKVRAIRARKQNRELVP